MKKQKKLNSIYARYDYKYNGKELQDDLGLGLYDMHFGQYDPAIGRFLSMDPVIRPILSPYSAFDNNPIYWADPTGALSDSFIKDLLEKSGNDTTWTNNNNGTFSSEDGTTISTGEPTPLEASIMAKHAYGDKINLIGGWKESSIQGFTLEDEDSGLLAKLYERTLNGKTEYALVYAGTQEIRIDGVQDVLQAFGLSEQYDIAVIMQKMQKQFSMVLKSRLLGILWEAGWRKLQPWLLMEMP